MSNRLSACLQTDYTLRPLQANPLYTCHLVLLHTLDIFLNCSIQKCRLALYLLIFKINIISIHRTQTTKGILMSRCIDPSMLVLDIEGFDGRERGQVSNTFSTLFFSWAFTFRHDLMCKILPHEIYSILDDMKYIMYCSMTKVQMVGSVLYVFQSIYLLLIVYLIHVLIQ